MIDTSCVDTPGTAEFFKTLYQPYMKRREAFIEVRCLPLTKDGRILQQWFPVTEFQDAADYAVALSDVSSVYMGVLPRVQGGGKSEHIRECGWLWCDIDGGTDGTPREAAQLLLTAMQTKGIPAPHMTVVSGGGCHIYYRLAQPVPCHSKEDQEAIRKVMKRLVLAIGGTAPGPHADGASTDPARILRTPDTWNYKQEEPRYVYLHSFRPEREAHTLAWWTGILPIEPHRIATRPSYTVGNSRYGSSQPHLMPTTLRKVEHGATPGSIHFTLRDVAVAARKQGLPDADIAALVEKSGFMSGLDMNSPHETRHVHGLVNWAMQNVMPDPGG